MTDEQIEQRAAEYAKEHYDIPFEDNRTMNVIVSEESYIAGAHSCDEEISYLTYRLNDTAEKLQTVIAERDNLRNPWISVKERLPEKRVAGGITFSVSELILFETISERNYIHFGYYDTDRKLFCSMIRNGSVYEIDNVTRWMSIPY